MVEDATPAIGITRREGPLGSAACNVPANVEPISCPALDAVSGRLCIPTVASSLGKGVGGATFGLGLAGG